MSRPVNSNQSRFWVVVPAAGVGARMQADRPKQYLPLLGKTVIEHTLDHLLSHPGIAGLVVPVADTDSYWKNLPYEDNPRVIRVAGGDTRAQSVLNGLVWLREAIHHHDWVLVHDVVRPCVSHKDIEQLITTSIQSEQGAVLGIPVRDTMKQASHQGYVEKTIDRSKLWHAFTPQMFRLDALYNALRKSIDNGLAVTDEASAMENMGYQPTMISGDVQNIKITRPADLDLASLILSAQARGKTSCA